MRHGLLEDVLCTSIHRIRDRVVEGKHVVVPLHFLNAGVASAPHDHEANERKQDENCENGKNEVHVQSIARFVACGLNFIARARCALIATSGFEFGFQIHQTRLEGNLFVCGGFCQLRFNISDVGRQVRHIPFEQGIVHVDGCWKLFGCDPLDGAGSLVVLAHIVHGFYGETDVVHVSHAVGTCICTVVEDCRDVHHLRPSHVCAGHVHVILPESIAGARKLVAERPCHRDDVEIRSVFGQKDGGRRRLGFVSISHVDVQVTAAVIHLGDIKRQGIKHINSHDVRIGVHSVGCGNGHRLFAHLFEEKDHVAVKNAVTCSARFRRRDSDECLLDGAVHIGHA